MTPYQNCTVRKMGLILRSIERMLKMQFIVARKFMVQLLRWYDVKPPKKTKCNIMFEAPSLQQSYEQMLDSNQGPLAHSSKLWDQYNLFVKFHYLCNLPHY